VRFGKGTSAFTSSAAEEENVSHRGRERRRKEIKFVFDPWRLARGDRLLRSREGEGRKREDGASCARIEGNEG